MTDRRVYHVIRKNDGSWQVMKEGFRRPHFVGEKKKEAVLLAKRLAKSHPAAQVIVHNDDDMIESEFIYRTVYG